MASARDVVATVRAQLAALRVTYLDLYYIHMDVFSQQH